MDTEDQTGLTNTKESSPGNAVQLQQTGIVPHPPYVTVGVEDLSMVIAQNADMIHRPIPIQQQQQQQKISRELKVEDALLYLDQVKMEFSDKPQIYNEFLDIMKNFKAQSINTPGVIERVKNLFRGYNKLILGFNTFLPEGEGYKIELTAEEQAFNYPGQEISPAASSSIMSKNLFPPALPTLQLKDEATRALQLQQQQAGGNNVNANNAAFFNQQQQQQMQQFQLHQMQMQQQAAVAAAAAAAQQQQQQQPVQQMQGANAQPQQMQQAHAIHYVTKIRNRFSAEPETYRSFLKILHTYQKEQKGIKEVLEQVSQLFADHPDLLMEFTYFLPDAVQEQAKERLHRAARESETRRQARMAASAAGSVSGLVGGLGTGVGVPGLSNLAGQLTHPQMAAVAHVAAAAASSGKNKKGTPTAREVAMGMQPFGPPYDPVSGQSMGMSNMQGSGPNALKKRPRLTKDKEKDRDKFKEKGKDKDKSRADKGMAEMKERDFQQQQMYSMAEDSTMMLMQQQHQLGQQPPGTVSGQHLQLQHQQLQLLQHHQQQHQLQHQQQMQLQQQHGMNGSPSQQGYDDMANLTSKERKQLAQEMRANGSDRGGMKRGPANLQGGRASPLRDNAGGSLAGIKLKRRVKESRGTSASHGASHSASSGFLTGNGRDDAASITGYDLYVSNVPRKLSNSNNSAAQYVSMPKPGLTAEGVSILSESSQTPPLSSLFSLHNYPHNGAGRSQKDSHLNVNAERRFFDQVKEVLTGMSVDMWVEFVKCLDLFSKSLLSRDELLEMVDELFGPQHESLYAEFKRLLTNRADYEDNKKDIWYAVPLSEIDFSQCLKCSPSYRALPQDYPRPRCSERSEMEASVLNDHWVSIPIGSEESSSFKHMRKNQYEEALFKCEDERFEIDMVIDCNASTLRLLEPLAEELALFAKNNASAGGAAGGVSGSSLFTAATGNASHEGAPQPRFSFQLEKRYLSTVHLNAIARLYGEHGEEILELLRKNPAGTVPVLIRRLRQKDAEWRRARTELNKHWKEVVEKNHYKSFDHRSFYFRQTDKKYLSTKHLVAEILGPHGTGGTNTTSSGTAVAAAGLVPPGGPKLIEDNSLAGISTTVSPELQGLLYGMQPQLTLTYDNESHIVHRDIYRIFCHAAETTLSSSSDKERLAALWRDLLRVFFNIPTHHLYSSPAPYSAHSLVSVLSSSSGVANAAAGSESGWAGEDDVAAVSKMLSQAVTVDPSEAWPAGTRVLTLYGSATIVRFRREDNIYVATLPYGLGYLSPSVIVGAEQLSSQALQAIGVTPASSPSDKTGDSIYGGAVSTESSTASQLLVKDPCKLFYGTQMCYIFMRLHHTLFSRLKIAKQLAQEVAMQQLERSRSFSNVFSGPQHSHLDDLDSDLMSPMSPGPSFAHTPKPTHHPQHHQQQQSVYSQFLCQLFALVEGSIDNSKFEDQCRSLLGNKAYVLYTLDKIVSQGLKHLQAMANDDNVTKLVGLFVYHHNRDYSAATKLAATETSASTASSSSSSCPAPLEGVDADIYQAHVAHILSHTMEDVFRIQLVTEAAGVCEGQSHVCMQHLGVLPAPTTPGNPNPNLTASRPNPHHNNNRSRSKANANTASAARKADIPADIATSAAVTAHPPTPKTSSLMSPNFKQNEKSPRSGDTNKSILDHQKSHEESMEVDNNGLNVTVNTNTGTNPTQNDEEVDEEDTDPHGMMLEENEDGEVGGFAKEEDEDEPEGPEEGFEEGRVPKVVLTDDDEEEEEEMAAETEGTTNAGW